MEGVGETLTHRHPTIGQTALCLHLPFLPTAASLFSLMFVLHAGPQYWLVLSCQHPIEGCYPSPLPSSLPTPGIDLVWPWGVTRNSLDHTLCLMLILELAKPKKVSATVKLCLWGRDCKAKCLRSFSHAKSYRIYFCFTLKLSDQVVIITEESDFYTPYCRNALHDSKRGKNGDLQICRYSNSCRYSRCLKNGSHCILFLTKTAPNFSEFILKRASLDFVIKCYSR